MDKNSLPWTTKLSYGVGHVFNDLCASMWFTYFLIFYEKVLEFDPTTAGLVLLIGQVADGVSTPFIGIFSDMENKIPACARYGRRKLWHLIGTILVFFSFTFIYNSCLGCEGASTWAQFAYYCVFIITFQFGWASVQISHLALIPDLTTKKHQRTELNSIRYAFTVLSNLSVFMITFFVLNASTDGQANSEICAANTTRNATPSQCSNTDTIGPEDDTKFRNIAIICCVVGSLFSIIFHVGVREPAFVSRKKHDAAAAVVEEGKEPQLARKMKKIDWFKELPFYQIAALYMATRLYVNLYQVYMPLYVQDTLQLNESFVATVPFAINLAGFAGSLIMKEINKKIGRKRTFALGCCVGLAGSVWVWFGSEEYYKQWGIFLVAALLGIGGSTLLITSLSITADLIGQNVEGGAFVYGFMSFVDKVSNGIIIMIIQNSNPGEPWYYRNVITLACGVSCLVGIAVVITLINVRVGHRETNLTAIMILEDSDNSKSSVEGVDNPAMSPDSVEKSDHNKPSWEPKNNPAISTISQGRHSYDAAQDVRRSVCQLRAEDTPARCECKVPEMCHHKAPKTDTSPEDRLSGGIEQLSVDKHPSVTDNGAQDKTSV